MKNDTPLRGKLIMLLISFCLSCFPSLHGAIIYSTNTGGNWNVISTWEGGVFPGASDDVIIRSTATVNTILGSYSTVNNLTVQTGGTLTYNGSGTIILYMNGSLMNNGTIKNGSGNLVLNVKFHLNHHGSEFSNSRVSLTGTENHVITFGTGKAFTGSQFFAEGTARNVYANSNLLFSNTTVDFNGSTLVMADGCKLTVNGQSLLDIILTGTDNRLEMTGDAILTNSTLNGSTLSGKIRISGGTMNWNGTTRITQGAIIENYGSSHTVYVNGNLINDGTVTNASNNLSINITGDFYQNGIWNNYETSLTGNSDQQVNFGNGRLFEGTYFRNLNGSTKILYSSTNLEFSGTTLDFAYGSAGSVKGTLVQTEGTHLKISGNGSSKILNRLNLASTGNESRLWITGGAYLQNFSNTSSILTLLGNIQAGNSDITFNNYVHIADTLMNYGGSSHTVYINGNLHNVGYIINGSYNLEIQVTGDILHHGMAWSNYRVILTGSSLQKLDFGPASPFTVSYLDAGSAHPLNITSSLTIQNTKINFFNSPVTITAGKTITLDGSGAYLINCSITGNLVLNLTGGAYIQGITFNDDLTLPGNTQIYQSNVNCNGKTFNTGTLQNQNLTGHTLYLNNSFHNAGTVINGTGLGNLILELKGDIINDGTWNNFENRLTGPADQHIRLNDDKPITAKFILYANIGGNGYQWYKNDQIIPGATGNTITLNQVTSVEYGRYYCITSNGQSRIFTINRYMNVDFTADPVSGCRPLEINFTDITTSPYPIESRQWEFGDGGTGNSRNPSHVYTDDQIYDVSLTVSDGYISQTLVKSGYISVAKTPAPDFTLADICFGESAIFNDLTTDIIYDETSGTQFVSEVIAYSSQWSEGGWSAQQVTGPPDVYPNHTDNQQAWASSTANNQREFLELRFPLPRPANKVIIYETLRPGSPDTVYVKDPSTNQWVMVWSGTAYPQPLVARAFEVSFPLTSFPVSDIRIAFNSPAIPYWNEIDAVAMVSPLSGEISNQTTYSWDVGEGGIILNDKGTTQHTYQTPGDHTVSLTVTNNGVCSGMISKTVHVFPTGNGGVLTGGSTIHLGEPTGILTLSGFSGDILKWRKRNNSGPWLDISNTEPSWSETLAAMGIWDYQAVVKSGTCPELYSAITSITVLKPLSVTWNGSSDENWQAGSNWIPQYVPDEEVDVIIPDVGMSHFPIVSGSQKCKSLTIRANAYLDINPDAILTIEGDMVVE